MSTCWKGVIAVSLILCTSRISNAFESRTRTTLTFHSSPRSGRGELRDVRVPEISYEKWASSTRQISGLETWASENGIIMENGFELTQTSKDGQDWNVQLSTSACEGSRILHIPSQLILSGARIMDELSESDGFQDAVSYVKQRNFDDELPQFFLWIKLLQEFEKGEASMWYHWIQSLPRRFDMALYYDHVEMECLPPYAWSLAKLQQLHLEVFSIALGRMSSVVHERTRNDSKLLCWALAVVFTRCWGHENRATGETCHIAPVGDMLNHANLATTVLLYDNEDNCNIIVKGDIEEGHPLSLSYGRTTNPSRFLVLYGFVDTSQTEIFSQILVTNPSQKHIDLGYDVAKMVFSTQDGSIAESIYDVTLFSILEQVADLQTIFHEAHVRGDKETVSVLRSQYLLEISIVLKKHVDGKLAEIANLLQKMDEMYTETICQEHPRLPMIYEHNKFLYFTFAKVKSRLDSLIKDEMKRRNDP